jgi:hypothetical protein
MEFGLVIRIIEHLQNVTTNNYDSLTELHTPKITVTIAHIKSSQTSLDVAWQRLQQWTLPFLRVPELSTVSDTSFSHLTTETLNLLNQHFRVRVTLRLAVYRQTVRLGVKPFKTHGQ